MSQDGVFEELKLKGAKAAVSALGALQGVVENPDARDADKIKAAGQIISIFEKAMDHLDLMKKYDEMKEQLNAIADTSEYDPSM